MPWNARVPLAEPHGNSVEELCRRGHMCRRGTPLCKEVKHNKTRHQKKEENIHRLVDVVELFCPSLIPLSPSHNSKKTNSDFDRFEYSDACFRFRDHSSIMRRLFLVIPSRIR